MKKLHPILYLFCLSILFSCTEEDNVVDQVFDGVSNGAVLRGTIIENEIPVGVEDAKFVLDIEEQDIEDGALLSSVDVYISYTDDSPEEGDSTGAATGEVLYRTIDKSEFTPSEFGLPSIRLTIPVQDFLATVGLASSDALFGGDSFTTRLELKLTDGRVFSANNAGGIITGGFFSSPFSYTTPVVCPVGETEFVGEYMITNVVPTDFGDLFKENSIVTLEIGETSVDRSFTAIVLEDLDVGQPASPFSFQLVCNDVLVLPEQPTNLGCGGSLLLGPPINELPGNYVTGDDSVFNIVIGYNETEQATCAVALDVEIQLAKQ